MPYIWQMILVVLQCVRMLRRPQSGRSVFGEMSERSKEHAWKACVRVSVPRVRIPLSPPFTLQLKFCRLERVRTREQGAINRQDSRFRWAKAHLGKGRSPQSIPLFPPCLVLRLR